MKNQERWDFAQLYSAKQMIKIGLVMMLASLIGLVSNIGEGSNTILGLILLAGAAGSLFSSVEKGVKNKFGSD
jgi:hypothetical protein